MKARIAKNDNFETVGFQIESNGQRVFNWGCQADTSFYFVKEVNVKDGETDLINLIRLDKKKTELSHFMSSFLSIISKNQRVFDLCNKESLGFNFRDIEDQIEQIDRKIKYIIDKVSKLWMY